MSTEERLARLEQQAVDTREDIAEIKGDMKKVLAAIYMGKGAWLSLAKAGAIIVAVLAGFAWAYDHILSPLIGKH